MVGWSVSQSVGWSVPLFCRNLMPFVVRVQVFLYSTDFHVNLSMTCEKTHLEIHFMYLGKNKFKIFLGRAALFLFYFTQNIICFMILSFLVQRTCFFINCPLKFQYQPGNLKINITPGYFMYMFVHIRKVFPKMFLSPTISFLESCICD